VADPNPSDYQQLVRKYDELRDKELELTKKRHAADKELQETRFEIARVAAEISRALGPNMPCW